MTIKEKAKVLILMIKLKTQTSNRIMVQMSSNPLSKQVILPKIKKVDKIKRNNKLKTHRIRAKQLLILAAQYLLLKTIKLNKSRKQIKLIQISNHKTIKMARV